MIASAAHRLSGAAAGSRPVGLALSSPGSQARLSVTSLRCQQAAARRVLVVRRFREGEDGTQAETGTTTSTPTSPTDPRLSDEQIQEVINTPEGVISPRRAEMRADMGSAATDLHTMTTFDGPIPETLNGRLCMLAIPIALLEEWQTGGGMLQQVAAHPERILAITLLITLATYVPIFRGYTRKEPYENKFLGLNFSAMAENYNGRLAMLGFAGMIATEAITGVNTLQAWGLQSVVSSSGISSAAGL